MKRPNLSIQKMTILAIVILASFTLNSVKAQDYPISNTLITTCGGVFTDDGAGGSYAAGQSYTMTICPDNPGDVISVDFSAFSLYTSPNPNNSDYLSIFDGDNTGANTLGNYTGNALQGTPVTGTVVNVTGCLTFVFTSNPNGPGTFPGWEGTISCTTPCANPTSASEIVDPVPQGPEQSIGICLDAPVTFGDIGSTAEPGFTIASWIWDYGDGVIDVMDNPGDVTHAFTEPGEYIVTLAVEDDNGCRSLNLEPLQVLVSTIPIFNTEFDSPVCLDEVHIIDANPIQSVTWTALPPQVVAGETYLADGAGFSYSTTLTFDFFEPGATLDDCGDLLDIFVNMEHSYLGDLGFSIECPNGTLVNMMTFATNSGGGTYLGEPVDDGFGNTLDQGVGYDYGWSPTSTAGAMWDNNFTNTTYTNNAGVEVTANIVNPGLYESEEDLCNLVGCPLNGDWTFSVSDNLGADNGYIFEWGINFNPALFPDVTTFTPVIGLQADSSFWEGPNIISTSADGNVLEVSFDTPGFYEYTYFATNNFGCTFDTTITIEAMMGPEITAGPDQVFCVDPVQLEAGLVGEPTPSCSNDGGTYTYCVGNNENLEVTFCPDTPGDGVTMMTINFLSGGIELFADNITFYNGDNSSAPWMGNPFVNDLTGVSYVADNPSGCITFVLTTNGSISCDDGDLLPIELVVGCQPVPNGMNWSWTPPIGLSDPNVQNPFASVSQNTEYTVTAFPDGFPGCTVTDQVTVSLNALADPGLDTDTIICYNSPISFLIDYLEGNPAIGGVWTDAGGTPVPDQINPTDYPLGADFIYTYTVGDDNCVGTSQLNLTILAATNLNCCQTNAVAGDDAEPCALEYQLQAEPALGVGSWSGPPNVTFSDINDPHAIATCAYPGEIATLTWTDDNGFACSESDEVVITFSEPVSVIVVPENANCFNECSGTAVAVVSGGTAPNGNYFYDWGDDGVPGLIPQTRDSLCTGMYQVVVTDIAGCTDSLIYSIGEPEAQEIFITQSPPLCAEQCSGIIEVNSAGATEYSFDGGITFGSENSIFTCAGEYDVIARNANGCDIHQTVTLIDPLEFEANFNINPLPTTTANTLITFQDVSTPGPIQTSLFEYGLDPVIGEGNSRISSFKFPTDTSGIYPVMLTSTNVNGCTDTTMKNVVIYDDLLWYIPNSFTPNGDGINDIWRPVGNTIDIREYKLSITDRWGNEVFYTEDYDRGWNGTQNGDGEYYLDIGVYTYLITVSSATTEEKRDLTGFITLIR
jgi:gliding motility-associated-like protein